MDNTRVWNGNLPRLGSAHGGDIDLLINLLHVFMLVLFVAWAIFFVYCLIRFRQRPGHGADYQLIKAKPSKYAEVIVVLVEVALLVGLSMPAWAKIKNEFPNPDESTMVRVIAQQFAWNMHYPGPDGVFGSSSLEYMDETTNPIGLDPNDPNGVDDFYTINEMHLPVDKPVIIRLTSKDVIHCFSLSTMRVKQDIIPGMGIDVWFIPTVEGESDIQCAQLCGMNHYSMKGRLHIESEDEYEAWLVSQQEDEEEEGDEDEFEM